MTRERQCNLMTPEGGAAATGRFNVSIWRPITVMEPPMRLFPVSLNSNA